MFLNILLAIFCTIAICPAADDEPDEKVYELAEGITPPRLIRHVNPSYTPGSRGVKVHGLVAIELIVTSRGLPKDPHVVRSLDKDVDVTAIEAVKQWRFAPAKKDGAAIAVRVTVEIQFRDS